MPAWVEDGFVVRPASVAAQVSDMPPAGRVADFVRGYQSAGGPFDKLTAFLDCVIPAESGWDPQADNGVGHRGLTQFSQATWESMMPEYPYFDSVFDPYLHGIAVARLANYVERTPGSTYVSQWSTMARCWNQ